jgi:predicted ATPase/class 3 adenylate cyclase
VECPICHFENPEGMNFCGECGCQLEKICSKCRFANPTGFKFCGHCGHSLNLPSEPLDTEATFDEKLGKIQKYLPKGLADKILSQRDKIEGERKQVTVMFCDMEGFTQISDRLGPEEAYRIMDQVYEILIHKVHDYEGIVNEMTGDGILALFGAPIAIEDAPQRAIRSAYAIHREMAILTDSFKGEREGPVSIKMRIGVHTGPVVVGALGNDLRVEFKAVGDTVNMASRMEGLAEPGTTYVTEKTFRLTQGLFRFEALGVKDIKGKKEPIKVYRVIAPSTKKTRFDVSAERGLTPFVGRDRELELLLDAFKRVKSGRGQGFSIMSEAGLGKSRLLYEFRKAVTNEDVTFLEGKSLSYSRSVAYHPVTDILKANFDIREKDEESAIRQKVIRGLGVLNADIATTLPSLLELLSVKDSGNEKILMSPEGRKGRIIEALMRIVLKGSEIRPLILAIEDLHWADKSSEDVIKYLLESIPQARVFLLFTYRPDFVPTWGSKSYHSQINLSRLSNRETLFMASYLLGTENLAEDLEELILEKTEGIPFFVEEFVKSLKELSIIDRVERFTCLAKDLQDVSIPSTIQDIIMARVDSLPDLAKEVLQTGSAIEREFSYELINRVLGLEEHVLLSQLSILKDSELLYERGIFPQSKYIFKNALTREVVYDSILSGRKNLLHEKIGNTTEELYKDHLDEFYEVLSEHYFESKKYDKAAFFSRLAARKAGKTGSLNEAIDYTRRTISCLEKLPPTDILQRQIVDARTVLGLRLIEMNYFHEAQDAIGPIIELSLKSKYERRISQIHTIMGAVSFCIEENFQKAFEHLGNALEISEKTQDYYSMTAANFWFGYALSLNCEFEKVLYHLEKTLNFHLEANNTAWIATMKGLISFLAYYWSGKIDLAYATSKEAIPLAEQSGDIYSKVVAYSIHGISNYGMGFFDMSNHYLEKGRNLNKNLNNVTFWMAINQFLADLYFQTEKYEHALKYYEKAISISQNRRVMPSWVNLNRIALARAQVMDRNENIDVNQIKDYLLKNRIRAHEGRMKRYLAEILLNIGDRHLPEAEDLINRAIEDDRRNGMLFHLGDNYAFHAELQMKNGNMAKATENFKKAIEIFNECGAEGWVSKYEGEMATLS